MDFSKLLHMPIEQVVAIFSVVIMSIFILIVKKFINIRFFSTLFPFTLFSIVLLMQYILPYSVIPYLFFGYTWVGIFLFLYYYKKNYYFTISQFLKKWITAMSLVSLLVWVGVVIYVIIITIRK